MAIAPDLPLPPASRPEARKRALAECARIAIEDALGRARRYRGRELSPVNHALEARRTQEWQQAQRLGQRFRRA